MHQKLLESILLALISGLLSSNSDRLGLEGPEKCTLILTSDVVPSEIGQFQDHQVMRAEPSSFAHGIQDVLRKTAWCTVAAMKYNGSLEDVERLLKLLDPVERSVLWTYGEEPPAAKNLPAITRPMVWTRKLNSQVN